MNAAVDKAADRAGETGSGNDGFSRIPIGMNVERRARVRQANRRLALAMALIAGVLMALAAPAYGRTMAEAEEDALRRLETFNMLRHDAILAFFVTHENEARVWAENAEFETRAREIFADWAALDAAEKEEIRAAMVGGRRSAGQMGTGRMLANPSPGQATYLDHYDRITPKLRDFITHHKFYDRFLFTPEGELAYSVTLEDDFGRSYGNSADPAANPYYDTGLGRVFRRAAELTLDENGVRPTAVTDFEPYAPSANTVQAFIAEPLSLPGSTDRLGVLALQMSFENFSDLLTYRSGRSDTVRTLLVGEDGGIRNSPESLGLEPLEDGTAPTLDTEPVRAALAGETFRGKARGERGQPIYVASQPLDFHGLRWAVLTEIDESEVRDPLRVYLLALLLALLGIAATTVVMYQIIRVRR